MTPSSIRASVRTWSLADEEIASRSVEKIARLGGVSRGKGSGIQLASRSVEEFFAKRANLIRTRPASCADSVRCSPASKGDKREFQLTQSLKNLPTLREEPCIPLPLPEKLSNLAIFS